jgi:hypothetical protein
MYRNALRVAALVVLAGISAPVGAQGLGNNSNLSRAAATTCEPATQAFPGVIVYLPDGRPVLPGDARRTISLYGNRALRANCTVKVICSSADNSKAAFEAAKPSCKFARDAIAGTQTDDSAAKRAILTETYRPEDGYAPNSIVLVFN